MVTPILSPPTRRRKPPDIATIIATAASMRQTPSSTRAQRGRGDGVEGREDIGGEGADSEMFRNSEYTVLAMTTGYNRRRFQLSLRETNCPLRDFRHCGASTSRLSNALRHGLFSHSRVVCPSLHRLTPSSLRAWCV